MESKSIMPFILNQIIYRFAYGNTHNIDIPIEFGKILNNLLG